MKVYKDFLLPTGLLAGTIIGAGIFALPYLISEAGLIPGFFWLVIGTAAFLVIHLLYADLIIRTPGEHRFVGYARMYLGRGAFLFSIFMGVVEMLLVMMIYLLLSASFANLLGPGSEMIKVSIFWVLSSATIFFSTERLAFAELLATGGIIAIIITLFALGIRQSEHLVAFDFFKGASQSLLPLGAALFAISGLVAIPSLVSYFKGRPDGEARRALRKAIVVGTIIPAIAYALFVIGVLALSPTVSPDAVTGIVGVVPLWVAVSIGALGLLALWSSYVVVGTDVNNILRLDLRVPGIIRLFLVIAGPLLLYLFGITDFLSLVSFVGSVFLGLEGILIVTMWLKARQYQSQAKPLLTRVPRAITAFAVIIFATALIYEIFTHLPG